LKGSAKYDKEKDIFLGKNDDIKFINLSPFIIDQNSFEARTDLSNLLFFNGYSQEEENAEYKLVKTAKVPKRRRNLNKTFISNNGQYKLIHEQLKVFKKDILGETN